MWLDDGFCLWWSRKYLGGGAIFCEQALSSLSRTFSSGFFLSAFIIMDAVPKGLTALTHYKTTNFTLFQAERVCRQQLQIWRKWQKIIQMGRKHCGKRRNCSLQAISPFPTVFSKGLFPRGVKRCHCAGMGKHMEKLSCRHPCPFIVNQLLTVFTTTKNY